MRHGRRDLNHAPICKALTTLPITVCDLGDVGGGVPDIIVGYQGKNYFFEIKSEKGTLRESQVKWHSLWRGQVNTIYSLKEILDILGISS